jgi:excisionase family DNA binding protein
MNVRDARKAMITTMRESLDAEGLVQGGMIKVIQVARFLGISKSAVYNLMQRGELAYVKLGKSRRIPHRAVIELAMRCLVVPSPANDAADFANPSVGTTGDR